VVAAGSGQLYGYALPAASRVAVKVSPLRRLPPCARACVVLTVWRQALLLLLLRRLRVRLPVRVQVQVRLRLRLQVLRLRLRVQLRLQLRVATVALALPVALAGLRRALLLAQPAWFGHVQPSQPNSGRRDLRRRG
jgi:hypothetical protein